MTTAKPPDFRNPMQRMQMIPLTAPHGRRFALKRTQITSVYELEDGGTRIVVGVENYDALQSYSDVLDLMEGTLPPHADPDDL